MRKIVVIACLTAMMSAFGGCLGSPARNSLERMGITRRHWPERRGISVTVDTDPPRAQLYQLQGDKEIPIGEAPQDRWWDLMQSLETTYVYGWFKARWPSGAEQDMFVKLPTDGELPAGDKRVVHERLTIRRPLATPGREIDIGAALQKDSLDIQRRQAQAQEDAAKAAKDAADSASRNAYWNMINTWNNINAVNQLQKK